MLDNELIALVLTTLIAQESIAGISGTPIKQAFQPTQQGANVQPTGYFYKVGDRRRGYPFREDVYDSDQQAMVHTEKQAYETTFQISVLATQNPSTPTQYTASDILNLIAYILQSAQTVAALEAQSVGILHIGDVRNPYFVDDRQRFEASPSLDFTLTHYQVITSTMPVVSTTEYQILTV